MAFANFCRTSAAVVFSLRAFGSYSAGCGGGAGPGTATSAACPALSRHIALSAGCPLLCPQPCRSPSMPTPARSSGLSTKATATGTSPSTKPGLKLTSIAPSSPLASDQPSWPPSTGEEHRNSSSHPGTAWGRRKMGTKSHSHSTSSVPAAGSRPSLSIPLHQPEHLSAAATGASLMHRACKGNVKNYFSWAGRKTDVAFPKFPKTALFYS